MLGFLFILAEVRWARGRKEHTGLQERRSAEQGPASLQEYPDGAGSYYLSSPDVLVQLPPH